MSEVNRERVRELFFEAMELADDAVDAYLDAQCGDDAGLRAEVASLLGFHDDRDLIGATVGPSSLETVVEPNDARVGPAPDLVLDGRYRELDVLGVGGCGRVVRAWDDTLKRIVAHKRVLPDQPEALGPMLRHEARLLAWLDHPGTVPVFDGGFDDQGAYYTMRVLDGETLRKRLDREGKLSIREAIRVLARVSETMANAHAKGVLHLDLKPANIMLMPHGHVCLLDWGVARFHDLAAYQAFRASVGDAERPEEAGYQGVAGTPAYMPVEQVAGTGVEPTADIYAAGTILYEMLIGTLPHDSRSPVAVLRKAITEVVPPRRRRADVPEALEQLCLAMIAADPSRRPASFEDVLAHLDRLHSGPSAAAERHLSPGEVLFREGEAGSAAYQILEGAMAIRVRGPEGSTELARRGVGDLVGEMAVVSGSPRSATVVALEPTRVAVVTSEVIEGALEASNPLVARMLRSLVDRLRQEADRARGA